MGFVQNNLTQTSDIPEHDSLFERWSWFYALCREYLFRDHTKEISQSLFPTDPSPSTQVLELGCGPRLLCLSTRPALPANHRHRHRLVQPPLRTSQNPGSQPLPRQL